MTTIAAIQGDGFAVVGADSRIASFDDGGHAFQISTLGRGIAKVSVQGRYMFGIAGDVRAINILQHAFTPPNPTQSLSGASLDGFITKSFIPALRATFETQGYAFPERDTSRHLAEHDSTVLVSVNATIYVIEGDYSWTSEQHGLYAIGTGAAYALGAMTALMGSKTLTSTQAKSIVTKSLAIAAKFDPYSGGPFQTFVQTAK